MEISGPWTSSQVQEHLERARIPVRLACSNRSGYPMVASLWYASREGALWCATQSDAAVTRFLRSDPRCGFEVAADTPPYHGVRGWARAEILPERGEEMLGILIDRYLGGDDSPLAKWLLARADSEVALRIPAERLFTWDYSDRMEGM